MQTLAGKTSDATKQIETTIRHVQASADEAAAAIMEIRETVAEVSEHAGATDVSVAEQAGAVQAIVATMETLSDNTTRVRSQVDNVGNAVGSSSRAIDDMRGSVGALVQRAEALDRSLKSYLSAARDI